jgi:uroporphyrinogen-III decarboxylase
MVSPRLYRDRLLEWDCYLARRLAPFGIHHCGDNLHLFASAYAETGAVFYDVGWGSDVVRASAALPDAFLNLRLSPVRVLNASPEEVRSDALRLLRAGGSASRVGLCCINMDHGTPDENVRAILEAAGEFARQQQKEVIDVFE